MLLFFACVGHAAGEPQTAQSKPAIALSLDTPSYTIRIEIKCAEGEVTCDNVAYRGESKRTKKLLTLIGRTAHTTCADKVTPCRFLGYVFESGPYTYFVSDAGELLVRKGNKLLVQESGTWQ